jgi:hypothetical protein
MIDRRLIGRSQIIKNQHNPGQSLFPAEGVILKTCKALAVLQQKQKIRITIKHLSAPAP